MTFSRNVGRGSRGKYRTTLHDSQLSDRQIADIERMERRRDIRSCNEHLKDLLRKYSPHLIMQVAE